MVVVDCDPACDVGVVWATLEVTEGCEQRRGGVGPVDDSAAPDGPGAEGFEVKTGDDAEVILTAF